MRRLSTIQAGIFTGKSSTPAPIWNGPRHRYLAGKLRMAEAWLAPGVIVPEDETRCLRDLASSGVPLPSGSSGDSSPPCPSGVATASGVSAPSAPRAAAASPSPAPEAFGPPSVGASAPAEGSPAFGASSAAGFSGSPPATPACSAAEDFLPLARTRDCPLARTCPPTPSSRPPSSRPPSPGPTRRPPAASGGPRRAWRPRRRSS